MHTSSGNSYGTMLFCTFTLIVSKLKCMKAEIFFATQNTNPPNLWEDPCTCSNPYTKQFLGVITDLFTKYGIL